MSIDTCPMCNGYGLNPFCPICHKSPKTREEMQQEEKALQKIKNKIDEIKLLEDKQMEEVLTCGCGNQEWVINGWEFTCKKCGHKEPMSVFNINVNQFNIRINQRKINKENLGVKSE